MAKKKLKKETTKKEAERKMVKGKEVNNLTMEIRQRQSDVKSFLKKFKADVAIKIKKYQEYAQESRKKKKL